MATWDLSTARLSLRTLLADSEGDKYEFKTPLYPAPDGITRVFSVGRTNIVAGTLQVFVSGGVVAPSTADLPKGIVTLSAAPSPAASVLASYNYQWFTDPQLEEFLTGAFGALGFEDAASVTPIAIRPILIDYAMYYAYLFQAQLYAEEVTVSAGGYDATQARSHPNWRALAELAFKRVQEKLKIYVENPLGTVSPALAFTAFKLPNYQGY